MEFPGSFATYHKWSGNPWWSRWSSWNWFWPKVKDISQKYLLVGYGTMIIWHTCLLILWPNLALVITRSGSLFHLFWQFYFKWERKKKKNREKKSRPAARGRASFEKRDKEISGVTWTSWIQLSTYLPTLPSFLIICSSRVTHPAVPSSGLFDPAISGDLHTPVRHPRSSGPPNILQLYNLYI